MSGYVKTYRAAMDHAVFQDPWLWKVFSWCVMRANFKDFNSASGLVPRGSFTTGRIRAGDELHMSPSRVYRLLHKLVDLGSIKLEANSNWTTVTICNYDTYQGDDQSERTADEQPANSQRTADEQRMNTDIRKQEGKKGRSNTVFVPPGVEEVAAYCQERGNKIDPVYFVDKYTGNGWMVGKTKMKDWRATIRTWEKNNFDSGKAPSPPPPIINQPVPRKVNKVDWSNAAKP